MMRLMLPTDPLASDSGGVSGTKASSGSSGTLLPHKLGIKAGFSCRVIDPPPGYWELLGSLPDDVVLVAPDSVERVEFVHIFAQEFARLEHNLQINAQRILPHGMIWVSWPKNSSQIRTDLDENRIRALGLQHQLVDVKAAAINRTWSGLKFVIRLKES
jgi:hypothetical protein